MRHAEQKKPVPKGELCRRCDRVGKGINLDRRDGMKNGGQGGQPGSAPVLDHPASEVTRKSLRESGTRGADARKERGASAITNDRHGGAAEPHKQRGGNLPPDVTPEEDGLLGIVRIAEMRHGAGEGRAGVSRQGSALNRPFPLPGVESNAFHHRTAIWP
jgi:hypothetical protein